MVSATAIARLAPPAVALIAVALGAWRLMPGVGYWDTAEFQTIPPILGTAHPTGYPTYVILGWIASALLTPFGEAAVRMNLLSAILVGVAAGITVDLVRQLTRSTFVGVLAGLGLALTPTVWVIGTHADPHALHLVFVAGLFWLLVRWEEARRVDPSRADRWLVAAAAVTGLSAGNHSLTLLLAVPIGLYVLAAEPGVLSRRHLVAVCLAALIIPTVLVYLELPLRGGAIPSLEAPLVYGRPDTAAGFLYVVTGEQFRGGINDPFGNLPGKVAALAGRAIRELGFLAPLVMVGFVVTAIRRPAYALLTGTAMVITCFFNAAYVNADIDRYYLGPALFAWTWLAILAATGIDLAVGRSLVPDEPPGGVTTVGGRRARPDPIGLAAAALAAVVLLGPAITTFPARAAIVDRTGDRGAQLWLDDVLAELAPNAVVISWWSYSTSLWYAQQIQGRRPDIFIVDDRTRLDRNLGDLNNVIDENLPGRPVYVIRADNAELAGLMGRYNLRPLASPLAGMVFRVTARVAGAGL